MIWFVYDANAIARTYINDIGSRNLKQIYGYPDSEIIILEIAPVEATSALLQTVDMNLITMIQYQLARMLLNHDIGIRKFDTIDFDANQSNIARLLLERYRPIPGVRRALRGVDSIYLATAVHIALTTKPTGVRVILITSYMALYQAASAEPDIEAFHFWTCDMGCDCGVSVIPRKGKPTLLNTCPSCEKVCHECRFDLCPSKHIVNF